MRLRVDYRLKTCTLRYGAWCIVLCCSSLFLLHFSKNDWGVEQSFGTPWPAGGTDHEFHHCNLATKKKRDFDPKRFLATIGEGRRTLPVEKKQTIYAQARRVIQSFTSGKAR